MNKWLNSIQDWCYPPTCLLCGDPGSPALDLCVGCEAQLPALGPACARCGRPLPSGPPAICGRCLSQPPAFDTILTPFRFEEPIRHLIHSLKFGARHSCARLLGSLFSRHLTEQAARPELLVPVPLSRQRYRERGFNQAIEIARSISQSTGIPLDFRSCRRTRHTLAQSDLSAEERCRNVRNAFLLVRRMEVQHVAIVDDVVTTGSTVSEIARVLRRSGITRVDVWACARA